MLEQLQAEYGDDMRLVYRHFPLSSIHDKAILAAEASEAAGAQGAFWEYHDLLFETQDAWASQSVEEARETFVGYAAELELDTEAFAQDLDNETYRELVTDAESAAREIGLSGTPSIILNGYPFPLQQIPLSPEGIDFFSGIIRLVETQSELPPQVIDPGKNYEATIITEKGDVVIELFPDTAPTNVNSFVYLAQQGWYDNVTFHRVLPDFMAQGGDPSGTGMGWPGYRCDDEITPTRDFSEAGVVAMANGGENTNGSQFFITYEPAIHLNDSFTIIGQVVSGQDVVDALTPRNPDQQPDFEGDKILEVTINEN